MNKKSFRNGALISLCGWMLAVVPVHADTVVLRDGRSFEGRIVSDASGTVVFQIQRTGIKSTMRFDRTDIEQIIRGTVAPTTPVKAEKPTSAKPAKKVVPADTTEPLVRLHLQYALEDPNALFPEELSDENIVIEPGRGRILFRLPITYRIPEKPAVINRSVVKVKPNQGRALFKGIELVAGSGRLAGRGAAPVAARPAGDSGGTRNRTRSSGRSGTQSPTARTRSRSRDSGADTSTAAPAPPPPPSFQAPSTRDPLYERVTIKKRDGVAYLECANTTHPKKPREARRPNQARPQRSSRNRRAAREARRNSRQNRGSRGNNARSQRPPANARRNSRYDERTADGVVMFVYAIPDDATSLLCTVKADTPIETTFEIDFLRSLSESFGPDSGDDLAEIAASIRELPGSIARVRLAQFAELNSAPGPASQRDTDPGAKAVVAALAHPERATRTAAFGFLENGDLFSDEALDGIAAAQSKVVYETIIAGTAAAVARAQLIDTSTTAGARARSQRPRGQGSNTILPSDLPDSAVSPNVFEVLGAVLSSKAAGNGTEGLDLILLDRSRQSVSALAGVSRRVQASAIRRLDSLDDPELAEPMVKTLLLTPDPTLVKLLLDRASRLTITIRDANDPLLTAPMRAKDPVVQVALLGALAQLPLDGVFDSRQVRNMLLEVTAPEIDTRVHLAALALVDRHWKPAVDLPVIGPARTRRLQAPRNGIEQILFELAASPIEEGAVAAGQTQAAAAALVVLARKGLVDEASAAIRELEPAHGAKILAVLAAVYPPDAPPNLGVVLGDAASDEDPSLATGAIIAIQQGFQVTPPGDRWRFVSALKAGISFEGLLQHTVIREKEQKPLSDAAFDVIAAAATLSPEEAQQLRARPDIAKRTDYLAQINAALVAEKLPGAYRAIVSLDVRVPSAVPTAAATSAGSRNRSDGGSRNRGSGAGPGGTDTVYDVSYDVGQVEIVKVDAENFAMKVGGRTLPIDIQSAQGRPGTISTQAIMTFDAAALIRAALGQPTSAARAVTAAIPAGEVTALADTELDYVAFGRWQGTIDLSRLTQGPGGTTRTWPEALDRIRIIIERVAQP